MHYSSKDQKIENKKEKIQSLKYSTSLQQEQKTRFKLILKATRRKTKWISRF